MLRVSGACRSGEKANIGRLYQGLRVVKSFRYLLTDLCELNILLRCPGWWAIGCNSINNAVLEPVWVHDSSYACRRNERRKSQSGYRRHDRQRARVVRFRRLRLPGHHDVAALLPRRGQDHIVAQGLCRLRRWLRHAAGRLGHIRRLWRSIWQTLGPERRHFSHGIFNRRNRATADLRPSRGAGAHPARGPQALAGPVCWRRVGRIDLLYCRIRTGRTARFHRLLATGQRRLGLPAWFPKRRAPQLDSFA